MKSVESFNRFYLQLLLGVPILGIGAPMVLDSARLGIHWLLRRRRASAWFSRVEDGLRHLENVRNGIGDRSIGIYIHIPFCRSICMFCPYFRKVLKTRDELDRYLEAVLKEVELYGRMLEDLGLKVVELHVGGGTPSLVPPKFYRSLIEELSRFFDVECGIGIEANPEDLRDPRVAEELYSNGVDEVSIGVQSFDTRVLRALGRKHSSEDSMKAVTNCLKAGFRWVNVDLMFLPPSIERYAEMSLEDKLKIFREDLEKSYELGVHQITFYATVIPRHSPGYRLVELGRVVQEVDAIDCFLEEVLDFVEEKKLFLTRVYSASRKSYEYATVNLEMVGPLIGFGAGAWSNTGLYQYINVHNIENYIETVMKGTAPAIYHRSLSNSSRAWRLFFDQLSSTIVKWSIFEHYNLRPPTSAKLLMKLMEIAGLAKKIDGGYQLTRKGIVEVYKAVINYVIEFPVKATEILTKLGGSGDYPPKLAL